MPLKRSKIGHACIFWPHCQAHENIAEIRFNIDAIEFARCNN